MLDNFLNIVCLVKEHCQLVHVLSLGVLITRTLHVLVHHSIDNDPDCPLHSCILLRVFSIFMEEQFKL